MKRFLFEYRYDGAEYGFEVPAETEREARERVKAMAWAQYRGDIVLTVALPGGGWVQSFIKWLRGERP